MGGQRKTGDGAYKKGGKGGEIKRSVRQRNDYKYAIQNIDSSKTITLNSLFPDKNASIADMGIPP